MAHPLARLPWLIWVLAVVTPLVTAFALIPSRGHLSAANDALIFVVVTVAVASSGNRWAAALAALASAAAFDFFLTRPYQSFRISDRGDLTTEFLFLLVGLLVGDLAARGRTYRQTATDRRRGLSRILGVGEQIAGGEDPEFVLMSVATQLGELLSLQDCRFVRQAPSRKGARIEPDGTVRLNPDHLADRVLRAAHRPGGTPGPGRRRDAGHVHPHPDTDQADHPRPVHRGRRPGRPAGRGAGHPEGRGHVMAPSDSGASAPGPAVGPRATGGRGRIRLRRRRTRAVPRGA